MNREQAILTDFRVQADELAEMILTVESPRTVSLNEMLGLFNENESFCVAPDLPVFEYASYSLEREITVQTGDFSIPELIDQFPELNGVWGTGLALKAEGRQLLVTTDRTAHYFAPQVIYDVRDLMDIHTETAWGEPEDPRSLYYEGLERLVWILQEFIDPDGWLDLGGETGTVSEYMDLLIITNTPVNHVAIDRLLTRLRWVVIDDNLTHELQVIQGIREQSMRASRNPVCVIYDIGDYLDNTEPSEAQIHALATIIRDNIDASGWDVYGGDTGRLHSFAEVFIIVTTPENHLEIDALLSRLREDDGSNQP